jgi:hypothetical protein
VCVPTCVETRIVLTLHDAPRSWRATHSCVNGVSPGKVADAGSSASLMSH